MCRGRRWRSMSWEVTSESGAERSGRTAGYYLRRGLLPKSRVGGMPRDCRIGERITQKDGQVRTEWAGWED